MGPDGSAAAARRDGSGKGPAERRHAAGNPYHDVLKARQADANRCTAAHGELPPGVRLEILIGPDGHPRSVTLVPASVDVTPLGACIKKVFRTATFPRGDRDFNLDVRLHPA